MDKLKTQELLKEYAESHGYPDGWDELIKDVGYDQARYIYIMLTNGYIKWYWFYQIKKELLWFIRMMF